MAFTNSIWVGELVEKSRQLVVLLPMEFEDKTDVGTVDSVDTSQQAALINRGTFNFSHPDAKRWKEIFIRAYNDPQKARSLVVKAVGPGGEPVPSIHWDTNINEVWKQIFELGARAGKLRLIAKAALDDDSTVGSHEQIRRFLEGESPLPDTVVPPFSTSNETPQPPKPPIETPRPPKYLILSLILVLVFIGGVVLGFEECESASEVTVDVSKGWYINPNEESPYDPDLIGATGIELVRLEKGEGRIVIKVQPKVKHFELALYRIVPAGTARFQKHHCQISPMLSWAKSGVVVIGAPDKDHRCKKHVLP